MPEMRIDNAFESWWGTLSRETRSSMDRNQARRAFMAGCRFGAKPHLEYYKFQAGRWVVTVRAPSTGAAKLAALKKLDERARKIGVDAPPQGWKLTPVLGQAHG